MDIKDQRARSDLMMAARKFKRARDERDRLVVRCVREGVSLRDTAECAGLAAHSAVRKIVERLAPQIADALEPPTLGPPAPGEPEPGEERDDD